MSLVGILALKSKYQSVTTVPSSVMIQHTRMTDLLQHRFFVPQWPSMSIRRQLLHMVSCTISYSLDQAAHYHLNPMNTNVHFERELAYVDDHKQSGLLQTPSAQPPSITKKDELYLFSPRSKCLIWLSVLSVRLSIFFIFSFVCHSFSLSIHFSICHVKYYIHSTIGYVHVTVSHAFNHPSSSNISKQLRT